MNSFRSWKATLKAFEEHESMMLLLNCLARSPAVYDDTDEYDDEEEAMKGDLLDRGLLALVAGFYETTQEGRDALIQYIQGH